jgi:acyl carrier protein
MATIKERVKEIISKLLLIEKYEVEDLVKDPGADSLAVIELIIALKTEFNIELPDSVQTVQDILNYLENYGFKNYGFKDD